MTRWGEALAHRWLLPALGVVVSLQLVASIYLLHGSYFFAEDFGQLTAYAERSLGPSLLQNSVFGHFVPGFMLVQHLVGSWFGVDWVATSVLTCLVQVLGTVAFTRLLLALRGRTWWLPWAVAAYALSVVGLNTVPWWAATLTPQLAVVTSVSTWGCFLRYDASRSMRHLASLAVMFTLSLSFLEKSVVTCAYLGLFVLVVGTGLAPTTWAQRVRHALGLWPAWAVLATLSLLDLAVYVTGGYLDESGPAAGAGETARYVLRTFPEGLFPSLIGAAPPVSDLPGPAALTPVVATAVVLALLVWTSLRSGLALRAWVWWLSCVVLSQLLVARGRLALFDADTMVTNLRYQVDAAYLFLIALAVALPAAVVTLRRPVRRRVAVAAALAPLVAAPLWLQSVHTIARESPGRGSRDYLAAVRAGPPERPFLDLPVPEWVVSQQLYPWNMAHVVLPAAAPGVAVTDDPEGALWIRPDGTIAPLVLDDLTPPTATVQCVPSGPPVEILRPPTELVDQAPVPVLLALHYTAGTGGSVQLYVGRNDVRKNIRTRGPAFELAAEGQLATVIDPTHWNTVYLDVRGGAPVCVDTVRLAWPGG